MEYFNLEIHFWKNICADEKQKATVRIDPNFDKIKGSQMEVFLPSKLSVEEKCLKKPNKTVSKYNFNFLGFYIFLLTYFNNQRKFLLGSIQ